MIFADISRAFDRISHRGLICKLRTYGFSAELRSWIFSFLSGHLQRTSVAGHFSDWTELKGGVPQGSVLGPLLFLLYINDLPSTIVNSIRLYADDTSIIFTHHPHYDATVEINEDLGRLHQWAETWLVQLHPNKTKCLFISTAHNPVVPRPSLNGTDIEIVSSHKHLGLIFNDKATWSDHIEYIVTKVSKRIGILRSLKYRLDRNSLMIIYKTYIRSL